MATKEKLTDQEKLQQIQRLCEQHNMCWTCKRGPYQLFRKAGERLALIGERKKENLDEFLRLVKRAAGDGKAVAS